MPLERPDKFMLGSDVQQPIQDNTDKIADIRNVLMTVKYFGAIGDGTSHPLSQKYATLAEAQVVYPHATALTDEIDWCAIQKAVNATYDVRIPNGVYMVNKTVVFRNDIRISGMAGKNASAIKAVASWDNVANPSVVKMNGSGSILRDINISCTAITDDTKKPDCILIAKDSATSSNLPWEASLYNVVTNGGLNGLHIKEGLETHITRCQFKTAIGAGVYAEQPDVYANDVSTDGCKNGLKTLGGSVTAHHFHAINSTQDGFYLEGADFCQLTDCHADTSGWSGYKLVNTKRIMMTACWSFDSSAASGQTNVYSDWSFTNVTNSLFTNCNSKGATVETQGYLTKASMYFDSTSVGNHFVNCHANTTPWGAGSDNGSEAIMNRNRFVSCTGALARYNAKENTSKHAFTLSAGTSNTANSYLFFSPALTSNAMIVEVRITARETNAPKKLYFGRAYKAITNDTTAAEMTMVDLLGSDATDAKNFTLTVALHSDGDKVSVTITNNSAQIVNYGVEIEYMHPPKFTA